MEITGSEAIRAFTAKTADPPSASRELVEASRKFEAIFIRQLMENAIKPILHSTPGSSGPGSSFYQYMFADSIAKSLSEQEQFGISTLLQLQLAEPDESQKTE